MTTQATRPKRSDITSPKRRHSPLSLPWYDYHAAFASAFATQALGQLAASDHMTVLDPWNGTGTTTWAAEQLEHSAVGFDLNPAMVLIAKARHAPTSILPEVLPLVTAISKRSSQGIYYRAKGEFEALETWFVPEAAAHLRAIERAIFELLIADAAGSDRLIDSSTLFHVQPIAAFFYVALFQAVRRLVYSYRASNPTWFKGPSIERGRLRTSSTKVHEAFKQSVAEVAHRLENTRQSTCRAGAGPARLDKADSQHLPLPDSSVDLVLTSPPYCTRLDYVKATLPELSVLGPRSDDQLRQLRDNMIGSPTVWRTIPRRDKTWGPRANRFLGKVRSHRSYASSGYYFKYFLQYFSTLHSSLGEIARVLRPGGRIAVVVQGSYYKEIALDLPAVLKDMAHSTGLTQVKMISFPVGPAYAMMNPASRKYRDTYSASEVYSVFCKE